MWGSDEFVCGWKSPPGEQGGEGLRYLAGFVLGDLVLRMLFALFALAVGAAGFGNLGCIIR